MTQKTTVGAHSEAEGTTATIDITQIEAMGKDVLESVQSLRALLEARAGALEACRSALEEQYLQFSQERETFSKQQNELCDQFEQRETALTALESEIQKKQSALEQAQESLTNQRNDLQQDAEILKKREAELANISRLLDQRKQELDARESAIAQQQKEWENRMSHFSATSNSLSSLQNELERELNEVASQKNDLLPNVPSMPKSAGVQQAQVSLERFQKLCRDAKRRAIGGNSGGPNT